jgi:hypothetical protein
VDRLKKALNTLLEDAELTDALAAVLAHAFKTGRISYQEAREIAGDDLEDVLLMGNAWRMLIPTKIGKSGAWEDRLLLCEPGESYYMPNIIRCLVQHAGKVGFWDTTYAIIDIFEEIEEPAWRQMPELVTELGRQARDRRVSATQIKKICVRMGLGDKVDLLIAELKNVGIMSPKLSSLTEVSREGSPIYELNPSLFVRKSEKR